MPSLTDGWSLLLRLRLFPFSAHSRSPNFDSDTQSSVQGCMHTHGLGMTVLDGKGFVWTCAQHDDDDKHKVLTILDNNWLVEVTQSACTTHQLRGWSKFQTSFLCYFWMFSSSSSCEEWRRHTPFFFVCPDWERRSYYCGKINPSLSKDAAALCKWVCSTVRR